MSDAIVPPTEREPATLGSSSLFKLFEAFIALREKNERQHKLFEQSQNKTRDELRDSFNSFAAATQRAYQQLRQEIHGEKRISLALLNELLEIGQDLEEIRAARPTGGPANQRQPDARIVHDLPVVRGSDLAAREKQPAASGV